MAIMLMRNKLGLCITFVSLLFISCNDGHDPGRGLSKPGPGVTDADGNFYETILVLEGENTQEWMATNLRTTKFANGDPIANVTGDIWPDLITPAWCYYGNDPGMDNEYGKLYNGWAAADQRNICPEGWHLPTNFDLYLLAYYLGGDDIAGGAFKEKGTSHWVAPNVDATNRSGLSFLPGGYREGYVFDYFYKAGMLGRFWADRNNETSKEFYELSYQDGRLVYGLYNEKYFGFSCRCVKDP